MNQKLFLKRLALLFSFLLLAQFVNSEEKKTFCSRFSIKLTGGWGSTIPIGDVNNYLESLNEVYLTSRTADYDLVLGEIQKLDTKISHAEAELRFDFTPKLGFGIATSSPFHKNNGSFVTYTNMGYGGPYVTAWTLEPEIKVSSPIKISVYYILPFIRGLNVSIGGGVGFYSAKIALSNRYVTISPFEDISWTEVSQVAKRDFALGFHGNIALEYHLSNKVFLTTEFQPRYVKINGFKGTLKATTSDGRSYQASGTLYYFTREGMGGRIPTLQISEEPPWSPIESYENVREALLDLGGYSLRIGIRVVLF